MKMKVANKKNKIVKAKKKGGVNKPKPKKEQVLVVAQEIKYARWLSGNDKKTRDRVLKALKKWLTNCFEKKYEFKEEDFTRVWKGLFYSVWMSDKPLIQEELCENIAGIIDLFPTEQVKSGLLMVHAGLKMLATEWYGIDQHRMDKFLMLVRRYLRGSLRLLKRCEWSEKSCQKYANMLSGTDGILSCVTPHYARNAASMLLHYTDCFLEELSKVSLGKIPDTSLVTLLRPFAVYTCAGTNAQLVTATRRLFTALLRYSEHGIAYNNKTYAWKKMGCPEGGPDALELMSDDELDPETNGDAHSDDDDDDVSAALDPRAGRVDVTLHPLPLPANMLANMFRDLLATAGSKAHRRIKICLERLESLSRGEYPLKVEAPTLEGKSKLATQHSAKQLKLLENKLKIDADELKLRGLSRKHRKRLLKKTRAGLSIVEDVDNIHKTQKKNNKSGEWLVESTETKAEDSNKENQDKNKKKNAQKRSSIDAPAPVNKKQKLDKNNKLNLSKNDKKDNNNKSTENKSKNEIVKSVKENNKKHKNQPKIITEVNKKTQTRSEKNKNDFDKSKISKNEGKDKTGKVEKSNKLQKSFEKPNKLEKSFEKQNKPQKSLEKPNKLEKSFEKPNKGEKSFEKPKKLEKSFEKPNKNEKKKSIEKPTFVANKIKKFQKQPSKDKTEPKSIYETPKKVKFELKNNSMQKPVDYYKSVRQSPNIPYDSSKKPTKTNLKPSTPSPINPFFKKKLRMRN